MSNVFERIETEVEQVGERLRSALEVSRLHAEKAGLVALRGRAAYQLGMLVHARERGDEPVAGEYQRLIDRMNDLTHQISEIERRIAEEGGADSSMHTKPAPDAEEVEVTS